VKTFRRLRSLVALFTVFGVLFSQLALSAYACQRPHGEPAVPMAHADMPDCDQPESQERSALCHAHCEQGDSSIDRPGAPVLAAAMPGHEAPVLLVPARLAHAAREPTPASLLERPTGPPLAVRHCRFRI
jgi:hypothetical protein